ncbi:hypothetical protein B0H63DRAFT_519135 [Podospora didyma]|uniref:Uncharacterized protein n=1 Tax=Podospora didyma TaxID=330526 RepID=A0AAE0U3R2_9PEZI|nr:hypothetical protein B0H63DRAFT_519135 [Podospora didyma]
MNTVLGFVVSSLALQALLPGSQAILQVRPGHLIDHRLKAAGQFIVVIRHAAEEKFFCGSSSVTWALCPGEGQGYRPLSTLTAPCGPSTHSSDTPVIAPDIVSHALETMFFDADIGAGIIDYRRKGLI